MEYCLSAGTGLVEGLAECYVASGIVVGEESGVETGGDSSAE